MRFATRKIPGSVYDSSNASRKGPGDMAEAEGWTMSHSRHCPASSGVWHDVPDHAIELFHHCRPECVPTIRAIATTAPTIEERKSAL